MKLLEEQWESYQRRVIPIGAPSVHRSECRRAFYAGAQALLTGLLSRFTADREPTAEDMAVMESVSAELRQFVSDVKGGRA